MVNVSGKALSVKAVEDVEGGTTWKMLKTAVPPLANQWKMSKMVVPPLANQWWSHDVIVQIRKGECMLLKTMLRMQQ